jgi:hypothetical protein
MDKKILWIWNDREWLHRNIAKSYEEIMYDVLAHYEDEDLEIEIELKDNVYHVKFETVTLEEVSDEEFIFEVVEGDDEADEEEVRAFVSYSFPAKSDDVEDFLMRVAREYDRYDQFSITDLEEL